MLCRQSTEHPELVIGCCSNQGKPHGRVITKPNRAVTFAGMAGEVHFSICGM